MAEAVRHLVLSLADLSPAGAGCPSLVVQALRARGADAEAVQLRLADEADRLGSVPDVVDQASRALRDVGGRHSTDVVHAIGWLPTLAAVAAVEPMVDRPSVASHLGNGPTPAAAGVGSQAVSRVERLAWASGRSADIVVLDSRWAVERALAHGVRRSRVLQATPVAAPLPQPRSWTRHPGPARVLAVGGIGPVAGTPTLIRALAGLPDVEIVVAARPDARDAQVQAAQRWVTHVCRGWGAPQATVERLTPALLDGVDLVVDAGIAPGRVTELVTAMAGRRAVVASGDGSKAEVVSPATTGELVAPGSWHALRRRVTSLLEDPFRLEAYGDAGLERYRAVHTPERRAMVAEEVAARLAAAG